MRELKLALFDPADQLACDEALLQEAEAGGTESFRTWCFDRPVVVLGRSSKVAVEVNQPYCQAGGIPVLRRCSGGAAIVGGPGCLMYTVVLSLERRPGLAKIDAAHRFVMERLVAAVSRQLAEVRWQGTCDLTWRARKFSGNSLRVARHHLLYHGTILHAADLGLIANCLGMPPRQPEYRGARSHQQFIINAPISPRPLSEHLAAEFGVSESFDVDRALRDRIEQLKHARYRVSSWHHRH